MIYKYVALILFLFMSHVHATPEFAISYSFQVVPKNIRLKKHTTEITLEASLAKSYNVPDATLTAFFKRGKPQFVYSHELRAFMDVLGVTKADFAPLEAYLEGQIKIARTQPQTFVSILDGFLKSKVAPSYILDFQPKLLDSFKAEF